MEQANLQRNQRNRTDMNYPGANQHFREGVQMSDVSEYVKARNLLKDDVKSNISGKSKRT